MRKFYLPFVCLFISMYSYAQIEVVRLLGKEKEDHPIGFGAGLHIGYPISSNGNVTLDAGYIFFRNTELQSPEGIVLVPIKLGYQHILNGEGTGLYIEPQLGYCITGSKSSEFFGVEDETIKGLTWSAGTGYIFPSSGRNQFVLGLRYESTMGKTITLNYLALRFTINLVLGRRE
jgi:hypothetical protein